MRLDDRITKLTATSTTNEYGETTAAYSDGGTFWADAQVARPNERREGSVPEEQVDVTLTARSESVRNLSIGRDTRLKYDGDTLRVNGVRSDDRDGFDEIYCTRVR